MKREICCDACARSWLQTSGVKVDADGRIPASKVYEIAQGEAIKQVAGTLVQDAICDGCGARLEAGGPGVAVSVYSDALPYFEWERGWIQSPAIVETTP